MNPLVSCIVPLYNGERFLAETLNSVFAQTYKPIEVILVDDGSTDGTRAVVEEYGDCVQAIWKEHGGVSESCNIGVRASRGEFLSFLDQDDLWLPQKTEKQMQVLAAMPSAGMCVSLIQNFWMDELHDEKIAMQNHRHARPMEGYVLQTLLVRRETFNTIGFFDESLLYAGKTAWFMEAEALGIQVELLPQVLCLRRMHLGNNTRKAAAANQLEYLYVLKKYRDLKRAHRK